MTNSLSRFGVNDTSKAKQCKGNKDGKARPNKARQGERRQDKANRISKARQDNATQGKSYQIYNFNNDLKIQHVLKRNVFR